MTDLFVGKCQQTAGDPHQAELICRRCTARAACGCNYSLTKIHHRLKHVSFDVWERCGGIRSRVSAPHMARIHLLSGRRRAVPGA